MPTNLKPLVTAQASIGREHYQTVIKSENHIVLADEPATATGTDTGMSPYSLLLASLASCTAITLRMYADRKSWPVERITVDLELDRVNALTTITRKITLEGALAPEQLTRMLTIANACPIHQILKGTIDINTSLM